MPGCFRLDESFRALCWHELDATMRRPCIAPRGRDGATIRLELLSALPVMSRHLKGVAAVKVFSSACSPWRQSDTNDFMMNVFGRCVRATSWSFGPRSWRKPQADEAPAETVSSQEVAGG